MVGRSKPRKRPPSTVPDTNNPLLEEIKILYQQNQQLAKELAETKTDRAQLGREYDILKMELFISRSHVAKLQNNFKNVERMVLQSMKAIAASTTQTSQYMTAIWEISESANVLPSGLIEDTADMSVTSTTEDRHTPMNNSGSVKRYSVSGSIDVMKSARIVTRKTQRIHLEDEIGIQALNDLDQKEKDIVNYNLNSNDKQISASHFLDNRVNGITVRRHSEHVEESAGDAEAVCESTAVEDELHTHSADSSTKYNGLSIIHEEIENNIGNNSTIIHSSIHHQDRLSALQDKKFFKEVRVHISPCDRIVEDERGLLQISKRDSSGETDKITVQRGSGKDISSQSNTTFFEPGTFSSLNLSTVSLPFLGNQAQSTPHQSTKTCKIEEKLKQDSTLESSNHGIKVLGVSTIKSTSEDFSTSNENEITNPKYVCNDDPLEGPSTLLSDDGFKKSSRKRSIKLPYVIRASLKRCSSDVSDDEDYSPVVKRKCYKQTVKLKESPDSSRPTITVSRKDLRNAKPSKGTLSSCRISAESSIAVEITQYSSMNGIENRRGDDQKDAVKRKPRNSRSPFKAKRVRKVANYKEPSLIRKLRRSK